ncbi:hypothetical protein BH23ACT10_BH23ACT10_39500 [soil metagenome]
MTSTTTTDTALVYRSSALHAVALSDGASLWSRDDQFTPIDALTAVPGGLLYGTGPGRIIPEIMAVDPTTGAEEWHFHGEAVDLKTSAVSAVTEDFVAILQPGTLFAIDPNASWAPPERTGSRSRTNCGWSTSPVHGGEH